MTCSFASLSFGAGSAESGMMPLRRGEVWKLRTAYVFDLLRDAAIPWRSRDVLIGFRTVKKDNTGLRGWALARTVLRRAALLRRDIDFESILMV